MQSSNTTAYTNTEMPLSRNLYKIFFGSIPGRDTECWGRRGAFPTRSAPHCGKLPTNPDLIMKA